jgi:hypothetical protein
MFGRKKKLYAEGAQTEGVVVKQASANDRIHYRVVVRAKFPDGSTTQFTKGALDVHDVGYLYEGTVVPVRYDPSDHSKVVLDIPDLEARHRQATATQQAQLDAQVAHLGKPGAQAPGGGGDPNAQLLHMAAQNPESVLSKLAELKQQGLLTDDQFNAARAKILGET